MNADARKSRKSDPRRGSTIVIVMVALGILGLTIPSLLSMLRRKNQEEFDFRASAQYDALVEAVANRALIEIRELFATQTIATGFPNGFPRPGGGRFYTGPPNPGLDPPLTTLGVAGPFGTPRVFAKGEPAFIVRNRKFSLLTSTFDEQPLNDPAQSSFYAPESDPIVWVEFGPANNGFGLGTAAAAGGYVYPLRILMRVCRIPKAGFLPPVAAPYNLGAAWPQVCPANHIITVNYTGLIMRRNL